MDRFDPTAFFDAMPFFDRNEYAAAAGLPPDGAEISAALARHVAAGELRPFGKTGFAPPSYYDDPDKWPTDRLLVGSRMRPGAVLAYHSALDFHGCAYASGCLVLAFAPGDPGEVETERFIFEFMEPAPGIVLGMFPPADGIEIGTRFGIEALVTTIERTVVDIFHRPYLGTEERDDLLGLVDEIDPAAVVRHAHALGDAAVAGALGFWLERNRDLFGVDDGTLEELRTLAPRQAQCALGSHPHNGRLVEDWNVILPPDVVVPTRYGVPA